MLLIGYCFGIRSERRLCEEVHLNLAYRWFCQLGLEGDVPDHSTFSKNRHGRFRDSDLLRHVFETVVRRCMAEGLIGGSGFAVDASLIKADANRQRGVEGAKGLPPEAASRAIDEYMAVWTMLPLVPRPRSRRSFCRRPIRGALDRRAWRTGLLRLFHELPDRPRSCRHRRCRSLDRRPPGGGDRRQNHDRADRGALRAASRTAGG